MRPELSQSGVDEFDFIARLMKPLAEGAPEALGLADDAAAIPARPGFDLIVTKDAMVAGVHFLPDDPLDLIARKLLRVNLSDLAAKGAEPYGYFLATAWPSEFGWADRARFAEGLAADQQEFAVRLMGGDTVSTPGPLVLSATLMGWVPAGSMVRRDGARPGDRVLVSGPIGDGWLGLRAARDEDLGLVIGDRSWLAYRYNLPEPRLDLSHALRGQASASADISDGLVADAGHVAAASGVAIILDLDRMPLSHAASAWLQAQPDKAEALVGLATGGDDYELICTAPPEAAEALVALGMSVVGEVAEGQGVRVLHGGAALTVEHAGWRHG